MIKKAIYDLIILMFISFQIVSCDSTASGTSGTSAINNIDYTLDQVFFNRLIFDYYHQIIEEPKSSDFYMYEPYEELPSKENIPTISSIAFYYLLSKTKSGAYLVGFNPFSSYGTHYYFGNNGQSISYELIHPYVWYEGNILYLTDAFISGLFTQEEIDICLENMNNNYAFKNDALLYKDSSFGIKYDEEMSMLDIERVSLFHDSILYQLREDFLVLFDKENASLNGNKIHAEDIHIFQLFAQVDNAICVSFAIDKVSSTRYVCNAISKEWKEALTIGETTIEPFQQELPVVWINRSFYTIDDALLKDVIKQETALELMRRYQITAEHENGYRLIG